MLYMILLGMRFDKKVHGHSRHKHHKQRPLPERGWIQFLLLVVLNEEPMHGYKINEVLEEKNYVRKDRFKTGSLYTILNRMEENGLLSSSQEESEEGRSRRVYTITDAGKTRLKEGLEHMLLRKRFLDEMERYYYEHFPEVNDGGEENA